MRIVLLIVLFFCSVTTNANWYLFGGPGFAWYQGDVSESGIPNLKMIKFNAKIGAGYDFRSRWGIRGHFSYGTFHGSDEYAGDVFKQARGISFNSTVYDGGITLRYRDLFKKNTSLINYGFFGFDAMQMSVDRTVTGTGALIAEDPPGSFQYNIPVGFGLGKWFSAHWGWAYEFSFHFTLTDYLDGTSNAGNPDAGDSFIANHFMLLYRFRGGSKESGSGGYSPGNLNNVDCPRF